MSELSRTFFRNFLVRNEIFGDKKLSRTIRKVGKCPSCRGHFHFEKFCQRNVLKGKISRLSRTFSEFLSGMEILGKKSCRGQFENVKGEIFQKLPRTIREWSGMGVWCRRLG